MQPGKLDGSAKTLLGVGSWHLGLLLGASLPHSRCPGSRSKFIPEMRTSTRTQGRVPPAEYDAISTVGRFRRSPELNSEPSSNSIRPFQLVCSRRGSGAGCFAVA